MKSNATKWIFTFLLTIVLAFSSSILASIEEGSSGSANGNSVNPVPTGTMGTDGNTIKISSTDKTKAVYIPSRNRNYTAGTFKGYQNGNIINFYCIDINTGLQWNTDYEYAGETSIQLSYVLNNYYPFAGRQFSTAPFNLTETEEAAATQLAIWHFSDNIDITNSTPVKIYEAAQTIIADANTNAVTPNKTMVINIPNNQDFKVGEPIKFLVEVYNEYNTPEAGVTVNLETNSGNLSQTTATTNASGVTDTLYITQTNSETATITAKGSVTLSVGSRYHRKDNPNSSQKLVLATPALSEVEVSATVNWYGEPDLCIKKTGSTQEVQDGQQVSYTITVTNKTSAGATATDVKVSDVLPGVLTNVTSNGNYDVNTGIWSVGDLAVGQSKSLTITATVDLGGNGNGGVYSLGPAADYNLFVLNNIKEARSDTEGKVAVGRDATFYNYSVGDKLPANSGDVLIVNRKLTYNSGRVYYGNVAYGRFIDTTHANLTTEGTIRKEKDVIDFDQAKTYLKTLSKQLFALKANGTVTHDGYGRLDFVGTNDSLNVFYVDKATSDRNINHYEINVPEGSLVIINYAGSNLTFQNAGYVVNGIEAAGETNGDHRKVGSKILLNFYQAKKLNVLGGIGMIGSILAPNADLTYQLGVIYGQVIVKNVITGHQFNWVKFDGVIKLKTTITNVAEILSYNEISSQMENAPGVNFDFAQMETAQLTDVEELGNNELPTEFELSQNYPNPFNPSTKIEFAVPKEGWFAISVYNIIGEKVAELINDNLPAGTYSVNFDAKSLSSGIYFYKLEGNEINITRKMMLVK